MAQRLKVCEGQQYAEFNRLSRSPKLWQVECVFADAASNTHARLVNVKYRHDTKTISCDSLADRKRYTLVAANAVERVL